MNRILPLLRLLEFALSAIPGVDRGSLTDLTGIKIRDYTHTRPPFGLLGSVRRLSTGGFRANRSVGRRAIASQSDPRRLYQNFSTQWRYCGEGQDGVE